MSGQRRSVSSSGACGTPDGVVGEQRACVLDRVNLVIAEDHRVASALRIPPRVEVFCRFFVVASNASVLG